jgi:hypothetical protein
VYSRSTRPSTTKLRIAVLCLTIPGGDRGAETGGETAARGLYRAEYSAEAMSPRALVMGCLGARQYYIPSPPHLLRILPNNYPEPNCTAIATKGNLGPLLPHTLPHWQHALQSYRILCLAPPTNGTDIPDITPQFILTRNYSHALPHLPVPQTYRNAWFGHAAPHCFFCGIRTPHSSFV